MTQVGQSFANNRSQLPEREWTQTILMIVDDRQINNDYPLDIVENYNHIVNVVK